MRLIDCEQGSAEWLAARCGKITASRMSDVIGRYKPTAAQKKSGEQSDYLKVHSDYVIQLAAERLSGLSAERDVSFAKRVKDGKEYEEDARTEYELQNNLLVDQVGFVLHPTLDYAGASPDSLVGTIGCLEIKCPAPTTHLEWMLDGTVPLEHAPQMIWAMACTEREWCDFESYCPDFPAPFNRFQVRLHRDEKIIEAMTEEVVKINDEVEALIRKLKGEAS